ncbi:MAG: hypothetical protein M1818_004167 [Claussenomyces sp. TS43310]|nr:MAG: hypothetical protein M1818_004167 [Claussenomyces sp. TS43310]
MPEVIRGAETADDLQKDDRLEIMAHDFIEQQPLKGADFYLRRWILHDLSDKYAVQILRILILALKKGSSLLISGSSLVQPGTVSPYKNRSARNSDIAVKSLQNAKNTNKNGIRGLQTTWYTRTDGAPATRKARKLQT